MLQFVIRKLIHKRWMVACLLIGNILLVAIACCNPMYTDAVLQRMLINNMTSYIGENNKYPSTVTMTGSASKRTDGVAFLTEYTETRDAMARLSEETGVPELYNITHTYIEGVRMLSDVPRKDNDGRTIALGYITDMPEHCRMIAGRMFSEGINENGCYEVIIAQNTMASMDLLLGETFTAGSVTDANGDLLRLQIVGVYTFSSAEDVYWVRSPSSYRSEVFISERDFTENFGDLDNIRYSLNSYWYSVLDYEQMRGEDVRHIYDVLTSYADMHSVSGFRYYDNCTPILESYLIKAEKVNVTLLVLQVPIFVLLAAFIFMVSRQMLELEQAEIAILKSRGAGKAQIIGVYTVQSVILAAIGMAAGIPLGMWLCQVLGSANAFLEFVSRRALDIELDAKALMFAGAGALFSVCTMVIPVFRFASVSIVNQKQSKHRRSDKPFWQKVYLDFILLGVSLYGLYSFNGQKDFLAQQVANGASLDPLLFLCCSLFILGAGLVAVRLVPALVWLVFSAGKKLWSPAMYASFLRVLRTKKNQGFIMVFLVMTIALGMFNAQAARTINNNEVDRLTYLTGTDIVFGEAWENNAEMLENPSPADIQWDEPDFDRFTHLEGVEAATKVMNLSNGQVTVSGKAIKDVRIMGIHTKEFGQVIRFKDRLLPQHVNNYLNVISQNTHAILVSQNFADNFKVKLGDVLNFQSDLGSPIRGIVYGFVEYWPGYSAVENVIGVDGLPKATDRYLIVTHLSQLQATWGVTPYEVWMRTDGHNSFFRDFVSENGLQYTKWLDVAAQTVTLKNDPIFQGTNGILTVGFIVVLLLCTVGFLIYWILSIQSRSLQFGIFRAMGMSIREIISMLLNEQLFISGTSIATGALVGSLASRLFIPLIQLSYAAADSVIPLQVLSEQADTVRLFSVVGAVILVCMVILGFLISRLNISKALKLGED